MASARVLSTIELGAIRFAQAEDAKIFPVEFKFRESSKSPSSVKPSEAPLLLTVSAERPTSAQDSSSATSSHTEPLQNSSKGEHLAVVSMPPGPLTYVITRGEVEIAAGGLEVIPPEAPAGNTKLASRLSTRSPSGAKQRDATSPASNVSSATSTGTDMLWDVDFMYNEELWSVRDVWVEIVGHEDLTPMRPSFDRSSFSVTIPLPAGPIRYRFRVALRDPCRPDTAPLTRLGWDPIASSAKGLATWELGLKVNDLKVGAVAGSGIMSHNKKPTIENADEELSNKKAHGTAVVSSVHVKSVAAKLEAPPTTAAVMDQEDPPGGSLVSSGPGSGSTANEKPAVSDFSLSSSTPSAGLVTSNEGPNRGGAPGGPPDGPATTSSTVECKPRRLWLVVVPVLGLGLIALLSVLCGRDNETSEVSNEDDVATKLTASSPSALGYFRHATSQGV